MYRLKSLCVFSTDDPRNICSLVLSVEDEKRKRTFCLLQKGSSRTVCGSPSTLARALSSAARRPTVQAPRGSSRLPSRPYPRLSREPASRRVPFAARPSRPTLRVAPSAQSLGPARVAWARARRIRPRRVPPSSRPRPTSSSSPASPTPSRSRLVPSPFAEGGESGSATASGRSSSTTRTASS